MPKRESQLEWIGFLLITACLGLVQFSIAAAEILFGLAWLLWMYLGFKERGPLRVPAFFWPLAVYAAVTLVSSAFSIDPLESFKDSRQLWLFFMVPVVARFARGQRAGQTINVIIALGALGALVGIIQYAMFGYDSDSHRPTGLLSHYMTYSGVLMLVACAAAARLLFFPDERLWPGIAVPALLVALVFTRTRNAWLGSLTAITVLLGARRLRLLLVIPALITIFLVLSPASLKQRAYSIIDPNDSSNRDRLQMLTMGVHMVHDQPFFGVGPEMVSRVYGDYLVPNPVHRSNPHLHNVPMQIAAERGLIALAAWLWFVVVAGRDLFRQLRRGPARAVAGAGAGALVAMLVAGLFEYNFGDSEFLILFLGLITLPYAAAINADGKAMPGDAGGAGPPDAAREHDRTGARA
jgi:O-antigen ligase